MAFTVSDLHDLIQVLEQRPELKQMLRAVLLTEELLNLPQLVAQLVEIQRQQAQKLEAMRSELLTRLDATRDELRNEFRTHLDATRDELRNEFRTQLEATRNELRSEIEATRNELRNEFRTQLEATRNELRSEIEATRNELRNEFRTQLEATRNELRSEIEATRDELRNEFRTQLEATRNELRSEIEATRDELRNEFRTELRAVRAEFRTELEATRAEFRTEFARFTTKLGLDIEEEASEVLQWVMEQKGWRQVEGPYALAMNGEIDVVAVFENEQGQRVTVLMEVKLRLNRRTVDAWANRVRSEGFLKRLSRHGLTPPFWVYLFGFRLDRAAAKQAEQLQVGVMTPRGEMFPAVQLP
jgi:F0F1-type ATP synthase membrane subunit b/b'